jgi:hypothetical protein
METVEITRPVDPRIADLVLFAYTVLSLENCQYLSNDRVIELAKQFWEREHGSDSEPSNHAEVLRARAAAGIRGHRRALTGMLG